ncbi:hypothetical protein JTB14_014607 [Gonioctena quinquepunctata]|nr:hypothetical protein JTB14_014607 [Gonioctena quinquepunctata]
MWTGKKPNLEHIRIFGCKAMVHIPKNNRHKGDPKSREMIFVGYCDETKGYRFIKPNTNKLIKSRDVQFIENAIQMNESKIDQQTYIALEKKSTQTVGEIFDETSGNELTQIVSEGGKIDECESFEFEEVLQNGNISNLRRSKRNRKEKTMDDYFLYMTQTCTEQNDPTDVEEAMRGHDCDHWLKQKLEDGFIHIQHVGTEEMIADILTKAIFKSKHEVCTENINIDM